MFAQKLFTASAIGAPVRTINRNSHKFYSFLYLKEKISNLLHFVRSQYPFHSNSQRRYHENSVLDSRHRIDADHLSERVGESSESIRARIQSARDRQTARFEKADSKQVVSNADMHVKEIRKHCKLDDQTQSLMRSAMTQLQLSARAYHRILKLARTIADLAGSDDIQSAHLAEALQYRPKLMIG